ncbi:dATP/dGTP diphosphohydrolase domain-containing protein [Chromobacterium violaceum]|uniref:dATP/dGTP diphosphohydrolase domain-containing protein n=1 Tax=Chromobacterium violaceum TaxID=536 RepID=UPI001CE187A2|nr:dATP/dGTP diphosphohydrolase domain-containing protein [Chromobacterium violaceum]
MEKDPHGTNQHAPGAKLDAGKPMVALILDGMPRAMLAVAGVGTFGAIKYSPGGWLQVPDGQARYRSAGDRHRLARGIESHDPDSKLLHLAHEAWNRLAELELQLRAAEKQAEQQAAASKQ